MFLRGAEVVDLFPDDFGEGQSVPEDVAELAASKLPPSGWFVFGPTYIDCWYVHSGRDTRDSLTKIIDWYLAEKGDEEYSRWSFDYQASW